MGAKDLRNEKKKKARTLLWFGRVCVSPLLPGHVVLLNFPGSQSATRAHDGVGQWRPSPQDPQESLRSLRTSVDTESLVDTEALGNGGAISWEAAWVPA